MELIDDSIKLSATDLVGHLNCGHLTGLDLAVANGMLAKPHVWDPLLEICGNAARDTNGASSITSRRMALQSPSSKASALTRMP